MVVQVYEESHSMFARLVEITIQQEQTLLSQIAQDVEFMDREAGFSRQEFERFLTRCVPLSTLPTLTSAVAPCHMHCHIGSRQSFTRDLVMWPASLLPPKPHALSLVARVLI